MTAIEEARGAGRLATLRRETFSALSIPNFRLYFAGQSISLVGTWMQMVAQAWLVLEITGSATWVGLTFAAQTLPILLVGPYGGLVADRTDKRRLLVALQAVMGALALVLAVLTLTDTVQLWQVLGLAALLGLADCLREAHAAGLPRRDRRAGVRAQRGQPELGHGQRGPCPRPGGGGAGHRRRRPRSVLRTERRIVHPRGADAAGDGCVPPAPCGAAAA